MWQQYSSPGTHNSTTYVVDAAAINSPTRDSWLDPRLASLNKYGDELAQTEDGNVP